MVSTAYASKALGIIRLLKKTDNQSATHSMILSVANNETPEA